MRLKVNEGKLGDVYNMATDTLKGAKDMFFKDSNQFNELSRSEKSVLVKDICDNDVNSITSKGDDALTALRVVINSISNQDSLEIESSAIKGKNNYKTIKIETKANNLGTNKNTYKTNADRVTFLNKFLKKSSQLGSGEKTADGDYVKYVTNYSRGGDVELQFKLSSYSAKALYDYINDKSKRDYAEKPVENQDDDKRSQTKPQEKPTEPKVDINTDKNYFEFYRRRRARQEDVVKKSNGKWVNRGDDGTEHGEFKTKKEAEAQRRAMFASGYKGESYNVLDHNNQIVFSGSKQDCKDFIYENLNKMNDSNLVLRRCSSLTEGVEIGERLSELQKFEGEKYDKIQKLREFKKWLGSNITQGERKVNQGEHFISITDETPWYLNKAGTLFILGSDRFWYKFGNDCRLFRDHKLTSSERDRIKALLDGKTESLTEAENTEESEELNRDSLITKLIRHGFGLEDNYLINFARLCEDPDASDEKVNDKFEELMAMDLSIEEESVESMSSEELVTNDELVDDKKEVLNEVEDEDTLNESVVSETSWVMPVDLETLETVKVSADKLDSYGSANIILPDGKCFKEPERALAYYNQDSSIIGIEADYVVKCTVIPSITIRLLKYLITKEQSNAIYNIYKYANENNKFFELTGTTDKGAITGQVLEKDLTKEDVENLIQNFYDTGTFVKPTVQKAVEDKPLKEGVETSVENMIEGAIDNLTEEEIDRDIKFYNKISRLLKTRVNDIQTYILEDGSEDFLDFSEVLNIEEISKVNDRAKFYKVNNIPVVREILNGQIFLYFKSDEDRNDYKVEVANAEEKLYGLNESAEKEITDVISNAVDALEKDADGDTEEASDSVDKAIDSGEKAKEKLDK